MASNNQQDEHLRLKHDEEAGAPRRDGILTKPQLAKLVRDGKLCVFGGFCLHLIMGTFYMWGTISPYIASYLYMYDKNTSSVDLSGVFPYMGLAMNCCLALGVGLARKIGYKITIFGGVCSMIAAVIIASFMHEQQGFTGMYCILCGVATGLMYMLPIACGWEYFPQSRGFVSGLCLAGFGFGSLVFGLICQAIVNPTNQKANIVAYINGVKNTYLEECVANQVPKMFRVLAGIYLLLGTIAWLLIQFPKEKISRHYELVREEQNRSGDTKKIIISTPKEECKSLIQGLLSFPFWCIIFMVFGVAFYGFTIAGFFKKYGGTKINDDAFLTIVGSVGSAFNGCSRLFWAILYDKYGFRKVFYILCTIQLIVSASIDSISDNKGAYFVWVCITYGVFGGFFGIFPPVTHKMFGHEVGPVIYGFIFVVFALANLATFLLVKFNIEEIGWDGLFWIGFALTGMGGILNYFFDEKYNKWGKSKKKKEPKKKAPKKIENPPPQAIELPAKHGEEVPIKDVKGNAIVKESADDLNLPNERQTRQNGFHPLETEETTNRH